MGNSPKEALILRCKICDKQFTVCEHIGAGLLNMNAYRLAGFLEQHVRCEPARVAESVLERFELLTRLTS